MEGTMRVSQILVKMIGCAERNLHDISHFMKVYAYAKTIGECEGLAPEQQRVLEVAAIVHDIACPLCREKYGNTNGKRQEEEGMVLARTFLAQTGLTQEEVERIVFLVGHHHTFKGISGLDYQILVEADYLANAEESSYPPSNLDAAGKTLFKMATGRALLRSIYGVT